jgi:hypothetical protein
LAKSGLVFWDSEFSLSENTAMSDDDYKSMVKFLSKELNVRVEAYSSDAQTKPWLSINSGDFQVTEDAHNDKHMSLYSDLKDCMPTHLH